MQIDDIPDCPYPFGTYLKELTTDLIVIFDGDHNLLKCNQRFLYLSELGESELKDKRVEELFITENSDFPEIPEKGNYNEIKLQFSDLLTTKSDYFFSGYIFNTGNYYCLIAKERRGGDEEILKKISLLNNALSNKTRKLSKKNKELEKANKRIEKLSKTDVLTGLANRRHFMDYFEKMMSQAQRHSTPLSLVIIDLDKFKEVNDTYGHSAGDDVLSALGDLLDREVRKEDLVARIGGEEFAILLTQANIEEAHSYAERIRKEVQDMNVKSVPKRISASLGISTLKENDDMESMMKRADKALYEAKENGRNKVCQS